MRKAHSEPQNSYVNISLVPRITDQSPISSLLSRENFLKLFRISAYLELSCCDIWSDTDDRNYRWSINCRRQNMAGKVAKWQSWTVWGSKKRIWDQYRKKLKRRGNWSFVMDRFSWTSSSNVCVLPGESGVHQQSGIRIYDGDKKVESLVQFLDQRMMFQSSSWFGPDVVNFLIVPLISLRRQRLKMVL